MPKFVVQFEREATIPYVGEVEVDAEDTEAAENIAENMLMQGLVDFAPLEQEAEFRGNAWISHSWRKTNA
jgi:hypothetical protein